MFIFIPVIIIILFFSSSPYTVRDPVHVFIFFFLSESHEKYTHFTAFGSGLLFIFDQTTNDIILKRFYKLRCDHVQFLVIWFADGWSDVRCIMSP